MRKSAFLMLLAATTADAQWIRHVSAEGPGPRHNPAGIVDPVGDRLVLVGGRSSSGDLNDVWSLDLESLQWRRLQPEGEAPQPRHTHNAVYDAPRHQLLLWSGRSIDATGATLHNDVWALDLERIAWRRLDAINDPPVARYGTAAIFDPRRTSLVNFAGFTDLGRFDDTWRFDVTTRAWHEVSRTDGPSERCLHAAAHDPQGRQMIIFGGQRGADALDDAWALDLGTDTWRELPPMPGGGRRFPAAAFDTGSGRFFTFGGERDGARFNDLWALRVAPAASAEWVSVLPAGDGPPVRDRAVLVYDARRHGLVLFGGTGIDGHLGDTWSLPLIRPTAVSAPAAEPATAVLYAPRPNPFNAQTVITWRAGAPVVITVHDVLGRRVRHLGRHHGAGQVVWDGNDEAGRSAASGVYVLQLAGNGTALHRRVALIR